MGSSTPRSVVSWMLTYMFRTPTGLEYCDLSRQFDPTPAPAVLDDGTIVPPYDGPSVDTFIKDFGRYDLLDYCTA